MQSSYMADHNHPTGGAQVASTLPAAVPAVPPPAANNTDQLKSLSENQAIIRTLLHAALKTARQPETAAAGARQIRTLMHQAALLHKLKTLAKASSEQAAENFTSVLPANATAVVLPEPLSRSGSVLSESCNAPGMKQVDSCLSLPQSFQVAPLHSCNMGQSDSVFSLVHSSSLASSITAEAMPALCNDRSEASSEEESLMCHESIAGCQGTLEVAPISKSFDTQDLRLWGSPTARLQSWSRGWERHAEWWRRHD